MSTNNSEIEINQRFRHLKHHVKRVIKVNGQKFTTKVPLTHKTNNPQRDFFFEYLSSRAEYIAPEKRGIFRYMDIFCGGGGLSLGVHESLKMLGYIPEHLVAADLDVTAMSLVQRHFNPKVCVTNSVEQIVKFSLVNSKSGTNFKVKPKILDQQIKRFENQVNLLVGGPPCQGHSNLNNHTRRKDPRNQLYLYMPAIAVALNVPHVIIENVRAITRASENVVEKSKDIFKNHGYTVEEYFINASKFGVAQTRVRHFLIATMNKKHIVENFREELQVEPISFNDINENLPKLNFVSDLLEGNGNLSSNNHERIKFLHDNKLYELPNHMRPRCHQIEHSYPSVYGRIHGDRPCGTITTGFGSPGRGRFVHPTSRRVINIRESARIQAFPDWYWEPACELRLSRVNYFKIIGDAVPSLIIIPLLMGLCLVQENK